MKAAGLDTFRHFFSALAALQSLPVFRRVRVRENRTVNSSFQDLRIRFVNEGLNGKIVIGETAGDLVAKALTDAKAKRKCLANPAGHERAGRGKESGVKLPKKGRSQQRKVYRNNQIFFSFSRFQSRQNPAQRALSGDPVGQLAASGDTNPVRDRRKQLDHVVEEGTGTPLQCGLIAAHSAALAARQDEPVR
jgi:hypothetical protein